MSITLRNIKVWNTGEVIDLVVVREGTEGLYCGAGGAVRRNTPHVQLRGYLADL